MLTNPLLNLLLLFTVKILGQESYFLSLIVLEIAAIITEAIIYELLCDFKITKALVVSLTLNLASYLIGFFVIP